jgi:hypothetical protein
LSGKGSRVVAEVGVSPSPLSRTERNGAKRSGSEIRDPAHQLAAKPLLTVLKKA